jgi:carbon-monoxide dehydrogenase large subunit
VSVGDRRLRVEDAPLLRGAGEFVDDIGVDGALHLAFVRSDRPHARVERIDVEAATRLPSVFAVVTAADLDGVAEVCAPFDGCKRYHNPSRPLLATERVRFVGEAVAVVLAESRYAAEDAAELVVVDYEDLPAAATLEQALAPDAPELHPAGSNVLIEHTLETGDVDGAFAGADIVVERRFLVPRETASPLEPRGVLAVPDGNGRVTLWTSTQGPHQAKRLISETLGVDPGRVRVLAPHVGGGFGQKASVYPEEVLAVWLALRFARAVKWMEDRRENLIVGNQGRGQVLDVRVAASADARLLAIDAQVLCDVGAYGVWPQGHVLETQGTPGMLPGPYRIPALRAVSRGVATNKAPCGPYRGVGMAVAAFVHERLVDMVAHEAGVDPVEARRRNLVNADQLPYESAAGHRYDSGDYPRALELACERIGYDRIEEARAEAQRRGLLLGVGFASYLEFSGVGSWVFKRRGMAGPRGYDDARVALQEDGTAIVWTSLPSMGQGLHTTFAQLAAEELRLPVEDVRVELVDTDAVPDGNGSYASRSAISGGGALIRAAETVRERLLEAAERELEIHAADLELVDGRVRARGAPAVERTYGELVRASPPGRFDATDRYDPHLTAYSYGSHAAVVEVDPATGAVEVVRYAIVEDCGRMINPTIVEGQSQGAVAQGIGAALLEEAAFSEDGQPLSTSFMDYLLPTAADVPPFVMGHLEHPPPELLGGFRGVGESGCIGAPAAVANAVADALGAEVNEIPITPEKVLEALAARGRPR